MMGDGMVSMGSMIVKPNAVKIRRIMAKGSEDPQKGTLVGFAGATADAFTLLERLEGKLDEYPGQLARSCVELAKGWRMDKYLRRLEAALIVADENISLEITGNGDVLEMTDGVISVGSGSPYALGKCYSRMEQLFYDCFSYIFPGDSDLPSSVVAAARALMGVEDMTAEEVADRAMNIAASMCVHTNTNFLVHTLEDKGKIEDPK
jgi:ATP-dependent HslUV protease subunit HslV